MDTNYIIEFMKKFEKRLIRALFFCNKSVKEEARHSLRTRFNIKYELTKTKNKKTVQDSAVNALGMSIQDAVVGKYRRRTLGFVFFYILAMTLALIPQQVKHI